MSSLGKFVKQYLFKTQMEWAVEKDDGAHLNTLSLKYLWEAQVERVSMALMLSGVWTEG